MSSHQPECGDTAVAEALRSVVTYCRFSEALAREGVSPEAVGLARAYKDVADRLDDRLVRMTLPPGTPS